MIRLPRFSPPTWLSRLGLATVSVLAVIAGFTVASLLFAVLLVAGLAAGGWLWWQLRRLARQTRQARQAAPDILDAEYTVERDLPILEDQRARKRPAVPDSRTL